MGIIFGKKKPISRVTQQDKAVLQLKQQRDKMKQYQKRIELTIDLDRELAKKLIAKNQKDRALLLLRKKRFQENLLKKTDGQLENLERLTHDIEFAQVELQVVEGLKQGNEALKVLNNSLNISDIERILDETREGIEKQEEINALFSGSLTDEDESSIEEELNDIISESLPSVPQSDVVSEPSLPEVPTTPIEEPTEEPTKEKKSKVKEPIALEA